VYRLEIKLDDDKKRKKLRTYEYVNISALHAVLHDVAMQCMGRVNMPGCAGFEVRMMVALICLTGTDFSRNLPGLSGTFVYGELARIWMQMAMAYDPQEGQLRMDEAMYLLVSLYREKYSKHAGGARSWPELHQRIQTSKLAAKTKECFPTLQRMETTVCNVNWVLKVRLFYFLFTLIYADSTGTAPSRTQSSPNLATCRSAASQSTWMPRGALACACNNQRSAGGLPACP
jgi:hypothetical protein